MQVQQLQLIQQQQQQQRQQPGFGSYGPAFIAPHPNLMYARDVPQFFQPGLAQDYQVPYPIATSEKPAASPPAEVKEPEAPPAKVAKSGKKGGDKAASTYASRHQAAESRRRQRINDRCDLPRCVAARAAEWPADAFFK